MAQRTRSSRPQARPSSSRQTPVPAAVPRRRTLLGTRRAARPGGSWRIASLILTLLLIGVGVYIIFGDIFIVRQAEIGNAHYTPLEEIFTESGIAGRHILTIDPEVVKTRVEASPSIESAAVSVEWPSRVV